MARRDEYAMPRVIQVAELIGEFDDEFPRSLLVKLSDEADGSSPLQSINWKLKDSRRGEQRLELTQSIILVQGIVLNIEIHKKHSRWEKFLTFGRVSEDELLCEARIQFDDLWKHRAPEAQEIRSNFKVEFNSPIKGLHRLAIKVCDVDLNAQNVRIKAAMVELNRFRSFLSRFGSGSNAGGMMIDLGKAASGLSHVASIVFAFFEIVFKHLKVQQESHDVVKRLAEGMSVLAGQLDRLKEIPKSEELCRTISESPRMMDEVLVFIQEWLKNWTSKHILVQAQKDKATELWDKLHAFTEKFDRDLFIEIRSVQATEKELHDLVSAIGGNRLSLREPCMEGTRHDILQEIETRIKSTDGHNVIWIRGSPGVGKSALAASLTNRLHDQNQHVIWFRFDRTQSTTITTNALWRVVACDLVRWYPSIRQQLAQGNTKLSSSNIDRLFKMLIEEPLSTLNQDPHEELPVIVIDALDECGGLRHDSSEMDDYEGLLRTLKRWTLADCLKKLKLIITSRPDNHIAQTFPESISIHVNIPSGNDVKPGDSASNDIQAFLMSCLSVMGMDEAWVNEACSYLVPRAQGMFIWATTVAKFLKKNPKQRFNILKTKEHERGAGRFEELYSLYSTVIKSSFHDLEDEEIKAFTSVIGAIIFAKQPLDDTVLMKLPGVDTLKFIRDGLVSVIDSGPILRFHHRSFEDFLLSPSFRQHLPDLSGIQDRNLHERQLALLCLNAMVSSKLHFNMGNLKSPNIRDFDESALSPLILYLSQFWTDHLVQTQCEEIFMKAVKFIMYEKLLFWIEVMSLSGRAHQVSAILKKALEWPSLVTLDPTNELTLFIRDAVRFISAFLVPISQSVPQIYISALPFTPERSLVGEKFRPRFPNTLTVTDGRPSQWPMIIFAAERYRSSVVCIAISPDEKTFASITEYADMNVYDSETGHCISGPFELRSLYDSVSRDQVDAYFSPDGKHILARCRPCNAISWHAAVWDIERGETELQIKGYDFVFIHCGRNKGRIASMHWINEDGSSVRKIASIHSGYENAPFFRRITSIDSEDEDKSVIQDIVSTWFGPNSPLFRRTTSTDSEDEDGPLIQTMSSTDSEDEDRPLIQKIDSTGSEDENRSLIQTNTQRDQHPTRILIKLWDIGNDKFDRLFEVTDVAVAQFSPDGQYLAVGKRSKNVVELWNLEDGKSTHRFTHPPGNLSSLHFSPTSDCLMAAFEESRHKCLWTLDTQEMTSFDLDAVDIPPAVIHSPNANHVFVTRLDTVEIWEVSMTGSNMIFKTEPLTSQNISSICPSRDGRKLLVGSKDGTVRMRNMEDLRSNQPVTQDKDVPRVITLSCSGKTAVTQSRRSACIELRDLTTWEVVGPKDVEYKRSTEVAFSADDKWIAALSESLVTICDIMHPENCLSFEPWPKGKRVYQWKAAFQTCNDLVICAKLEGNSNSGLLQVWKLKDHSECTFSLEFNDWFSCIYLAPDGLTVIFALASSYSWNNKTAQFDHIHFTDEAHLGGDKWAYSPDGKVFASSSPKDKGVRVWDTRTGQLLGKPITMPDAYVSKIALSPALSNGPLGDRLIAILWGGSDTVTLFDVHTGHLYAQRWDPGLYMAFIPIRDGIKLAMWSPSFVAGAVRFHDLAAYHRNATYGYEHVLRDIKDGWMVGQDDELLFWVPLEHRKVLCLFDVEAIGGRPTRVDFSRFRYGSTWTECIDQTWLKQLEEREMEMARLLE